MISVPYAAVRRPVRIPFRILAALIGIASLFALTGTVFMAWRGVHSIPAEFVLMLPLTAWFNRLMFYAVLRGTIPAICEYWPLASKRVWNWYMCILFAYWIFKP